MSNHSIRASQAKTFGGTVAINQSTRSSSRQLLVAAINSGRALPVAKRHRAMCYCRSRACVNGFWTYEQAICRQHVGGSVLQTWRRAEGMIDEHPVTAQV